MARYDIGFTKAALSAAGMIAQLRAGSGRDLRLFEIGFFATTAVTAEFGLIRPTAVGATFTSTAVGAALDNASAAGVAVVDTAATTPPTIGTNYMRRIQLPATAGAGVIWTFPNGINIPVSTSLALWQITAAAGPAISGYVDYDE